MKPPRKPVMESAPIRLTQGADPIPTDTDFWRAPPGETVNVAPEAFKTAEGVGKQLLGERGGGTTSSGGRGDPALGGGSDPCTEGELVPYTEGELVDLFSDEINTTTTRWTIGDGIEIDRDTRVVTRVTEEFGTENSEVGDWADSSGSDTDDRGGEYTLEVPHDGPRECPVCRLEYTSTRVLRNHARERHKSLVLKFKCTGCGKSWDKLHSAECHIPYCRGERNVGSDFRFECEVCGQKAATLSGLGQHRRHQHPREANAHRILHAGNKKKRVQFGPLPARP